MEIKLIYQDGSSNKFWNVKVEGNTHTVTYGRAGTNGSSKTKEFADEAAALKDAQKQANGKKRKGYVEAATKAKVVWDGNNFAGKPVRAFGSSINPATAVKVAYSWNSETEFTDKMNKLFKVPNLSEMDTLIIGMWDEEQFDVDGNFILEMLIEKKAELSGLKHLFIGDMDYDECEISWIQQADYTNFWTHFPQLESFGVKGGDGLKFGVVQLPNLRNLIIETGGLGGDVIQDLGVSDLSKLEHIDIWLGTEDYGGTVTIEDLVPLLNGDFPHLKYLGLKNYDQQDDLAKALLGAPILEGIETLDFSMGILTDEGAQALYQNDALLKLKHIDCNHHFLTDEWQKKLRTKFAAQNINLSGGEDPEDDYKYVEVGGVRAGSCWPLPC